MHLPAVGGREIMKTPTQSSKAPSKKGVRLEYSKTLTELTKENAQQKNEIQALKDKLAEITQILHSQEQAHKQFLTVHQEMKTLQKDAALNLSKTKQELTVFSTSFKAYTELPQEIQNFIQKREKEMDSQKTEVNKVITDVFNQLNALLNGEAKPHQKTVDTVTQQLLIMSKRLDKLEARLR